MKRILSTALAISLLLGLGALAIIASPNGAGSLLPAARPAAVALAASNFQGAAAPDAPLATKYNVIGMPLDATNQFTNLGLGFDSEGLADLVGTSVTQVLRWNTAYQQFDVWYPGDDGDGNGDGTVNGNYTSTPYALAVGGSYWLLVGSTSPTVVSFVGDVPNAGSVKFTWNATLAGCSYNAITIPLEQSTLTDSELLADHISATDISQVLRWNANLQQFDVWYPGDDGDGNGDGTVDGNYTTTPWQVKIGYPYWVCLYSGANGVQWP